MWMQGKRKSKDDRHAAIGPSYFMKEGLDDAAVERIWKHSVLPYIEERRFGCGRSADIQDFDLERLKSRKPAKARKAGITQTAMNQQWLRSTSRNTNESGPHPLTVAQRDALKEQYVQGSALSHRHLVRRRNITLTPGSMVQGRWKLAGISIVIEPKIGISQLICRWLATPLVRWNSKTRDFPFPEQSDLH